MMQIGKLYKPIDSTDMNPSVVSVVVNWNNKLLMIECIESLLTSGYKNHQILLVDNASSDDSVLSAKSLFPTITIIQNDKNYGYTGGNNIGLKWALYNNFDFIHLINNDAIVATDTISKLIEFACSDAAIGMVGPKILFYDNPNLIWSLGGKLNLFGINGGGSSHLFYKKENDGVNDLPFDVMYLPGCSLIIKQSVVREIGILDENFFAYGEDIDWAIRIRNAGFRVVAVPSAIVWHRVSSSTMHALSNFSIYMMTRNQLYLRSKHNRKFPGKLKYYLYLLVSIPLQFILNFFKINLLFRDANNRSLIQLGKAYLMGISDFYNNKLGYQHYLNNNN